MRRLTVAALILILLTTMIAATVTDSSVVTELARAEGYVQLDQSMQGIAVAQLRSTVPVR